MESDTDDTMDEEEATISLVQTLTPASGEVDINSLKMTALKEGKFTDCVFLVGPSGKQETVHAVKAIMVMCSPYMEGLFRNPPKSPIRIKHTEPNVFKLMTEFIHLGQLVTPVTCEELAILAVASDHFLVDSLRSFCKTRLKEIVSVETVWTVLDIVLQVPLLDVAACCKSILMMKTDACLENPLFLIATSRSVRYLLHLKKLDLIDEWQLTKYCVTWAEHQENCSESFRTLVSVLRLATLSPEQLAQLPNYLTPEENVALLKYSITKDFNSTSFPATLCTILDKRNFRKPKVNREDGKYKETKIDCIPREICQKNKLDLEDTDKFSTTSDITNVLYITPEIDIYLTRFEFICKVSGDFELKYNEEINGYQMKTQKEQYIQKCTVQLKENGLLSLINNSVDPEHVSLPFYLFKPRLLKKDQKHKVSLKMLVDSPCYFRKISYKTANSHFLKHLNKHLFASICFEDCGETPIVLKSFSFTTRD